MSKSIDFSNRGSLLHLRLASKLKNKNYDWLVNFNHPYSFSQHLKSCNAVKTSFGNTVCALTTKVEQNEMYQFRMRLLKSILLSSSQVSFWSASMPINHSYSSFEIVKSFKFHKIQLEKYLLWLSNNLPYKSFEQSCTLISRKKKKLSNFRVKKKKTFTVQKWT